MLFRSLLPQTELTLNLLRQSQVQPLISAYECMHGPFDYNATPLGPLGCAVIVHKKNAQRHTWDFRGREGWSIGAAMESYRCDKVVPRNTMVLTQSSTATIISHFLLSRQQIGSYMAFTC